MQLIDKITALNDKCWNVYLRRGPIFNPADVVTNWPRETWRLFNEGKAQEFANIQAEIYQLKEANQANWERAVDEALNSEYDWAGCPGLKF